METLEKIVSISDPVELRKKLIQYIDEHPSDKDKILLKMNNLSLNFDIWEENLGEPFEIDYYKWTDTYYRNLRIRLLNNFSKEKFLHTLDVSEYLEQHRSLLLSENGNEKINLYGNSKGYIMIGGVVVFLIIVVLMVFYFKNKYI